MVLNDTSLAIPGTGSSHDVSEQATIQKNRHVASMWKLLQLDEENIFIYITKFQSREHPVARNCLDFNLNFGIDYELYKP